MKTTELPACMYLYLVSAERNGQSYWKIGITKHKNPLLRNRACYKEAFRSVEFKTYLETHCFSGEQSERNDADYCEWWLKKAIKRIKGGCPIGTESIDYQASLEAVTALFDKMVQWTVSGDITWLDEDEPEMWSTQERLIDQIESSIAEARAQKANTKQAEPMWA